MENVTNTISILGSGWLGTPLAQHFANLNYAVSLSTRSQAKLNALSDTNITPYLIDIESLTATGADFFNSDNLVINITSKNIEAYKNLICYIEQSQIKHVLFVSSSSVYSSSNSIVSEESNDENPDSVLYQIESLFRENQHFQTTIIRLSGLIGYSRHPGNFFRNGKQVEHAEAPVNLIHRDDCIGIINAIIQQNKWGHVFNGCADTHPSKRVFYSHARALLDLPNPVFVETANPEFKIVSNNKVKHVLDYSFSYPDVMTIPFGTNA